MDNSWRLPVWSRVAGAPECQGVIRAEPDDFHVQELPLITPEGQGGHLWLEIEKREANTDWVARQLATCAGVSGRDVGYAGMKDRRAVTRQWFSVALQEARNPDWDSWKIPGAKILNAQLHTRKLRRGVLAGNRFRLVVRNLAGDLSQLQERLQRVKQNGVPNYFGSQRFGHDGQNVVRGSRWLEHGGRLPRNKKSIYISAVRSFLFNEVLSTRVERQAWNRLLDGDIASLDGSRSTFRCTLPDPELARRCGEFDIHPSGPLPGKGGDCVQRLAAATEQAALGQWQTLVSGLEAAGVKSARRPLRLLPKKMRWDLSGEELVLVFELSRGGYATSVLRELVTSSPGSISEAT
jgi:tRNA pseudouridine13 synthase